MHAVQGQRKFHTQKRNDILHVVESGLSRMTQLCSLRVSVLCNTVMFSTVVDQSDYSTHIITRKMIIIMRGESSFVASGVTVLNI